MLCSFLCHVHQICPGPCPAAPAVAAPLFFWGTFKTKTQTAKATTLSMTPSCTIQTPYIAVEWFSLPTAFSTHRVDTHPLSLFQEGVCWPQLLWCPARRHCWAPGSRWLWAALLGYPPPAPSRLDYRCWPSLPAANNWPWFKNLAGKFGCLRERERGGSGQRASVGLDPSARLPGTHLTLLKWRRPSPSQGIPLRALAVMSD